MGVADGSIYTVVLYHTSIFDTTLLLNITCTLVATKHDITELRVYYGCGRWGFDQPQ